MHMNGKKIYVGWKRRRRPENPKHRKLVLGWGVKRDRNEFHV